MSQAITHEPSKPTNVRPLIEAHAVLGRNVRSSMAIQTKLQFNGGKSHKRNRKSEKRNVRSQP
jgi:hypothetical protein